MTEALQKDRTESRSAGRTRMCALTREVRPEAELIRFVAAPDGSVVADLKAKLPGRGIWLGAERSIVAEGVKRNVFQRGLKKPVKPADDLADKVAERLESSGPWAAWPGLQGGRRSCRLCQGRGGDRRPAAPGRDHRRRRWKRWRTQA